MPAASTANQTAATIAANPAIAPVADVVAELYGYGPQNPGGIDPNLAVSAAAGPVIDVAGTPGAPTNTDLTSHPTTPQPGDPNTGQTAGIETQRTTDNLPV